MNLSEYLTESIVPRKTGVYQEQSFLDTMDTSMKYKDFSVYISRTAYLYGVISIEDIRERDAFNKIYGLALRNHGLSYAKWYNSLLGIWKVVVCNRYGKMVILEFDESKGTLLGRIDTLEYNRSGRYFELNDVYYGGQLGFGIVELKKLIEDKA